MNHITEYKKILNRGLAFTPGEYIKGLGDAEYNLLGMELIIDLYRSLLVIEYRRFNGPLGVGAEYLFLVRTEKTLFYRLLILHISLKNLRVSLKKALIYWEIWKVFKK